MIAALYVQTGGVYFGLPDVDPWDGTEGRDARNYPGPWPVVAHPPCARWGSLAPVVEKRWGHKRGDDGGCFASALALVRTYGGVLEHPAYSRAWQAFGLKRPLRDGWWSAGIGDAGWCARVDQRFYGHRATKQTWLYAVGCALPSLRWGKSPPSNVWISNLSMSGKGLVVERMGKRERAATPTAFRDVLLDMARSVKP